MPHAVDQYWVAQEKEYQKELQITRGPNEPAIRFPLVVQPHEPAKSKAEVLKEAGRIAAQPSDKNEQSQLRKLLDANGGVVHFKGLPLKTPEDFSDFLVALAGQGQHAWIPHTDVGMEVLRRPRAKHVSLSLFLGAPHPISSVGTTNMPSRRSTLGTSFSFARCPPRRVVRHRS